MQDSFQRAKASSVSARRRSRRAVSDSHLKDGAKGASDSTADVPKQLEQSAPQVVETQDMHSGGHTSPRLGDQRGTVVHFHTPSGLPTVSVLAQSTPEHAHAPDRAPSPASAAGVDSSIPVASDCHAAQAGGSHSAINRGNDTAAAAVAAAAVTVAASAAATTAAVEKLEGVVQLLGRLLVPAESGAAAASAADRLAVDNARLTRDLRAALQSALAVCGFVSNSRNVGGFSGAGIQEEGEKDAGKLGAEKKFEGKLSALEIALANEQAKVASNPHQLSLPFCFPLLYSYS